MGIRVEDVERILVASCAHLPKKTQVTVLEAMRKECEAITAKQDGQTEFYRYLNEEMHKGLQEIFQQISAASAPSSSHADDTQKLFTDASRQLEEVMLTVLEATETIMGLTEQLMEKQEEARDIVGQLRTSANITKLERLYALMDDSNEALIEIMTTLSFQDLTGQRIKKIVDAITAIREKVFDLYVSTGLMLKHSEQIEEKGIEQIKEESRKTVAELKTKSIEGSELKGPSLTASQGDVDDLLASLGL